MSKKVHITLVGGQTMPVYLCINEFDPEYIVFAHSEETRKIAERIAGNYKGTCELICLDPVDMKNIYSAVKELIMRFDTEDVTINLTGGTKPWTIAFAVETQGRNNIHLIYVDQNCIFYDYTSGEKWRTEAVLSMQQLMHIKGQMPQSYRVLGDYDEDDLYMLDKVKLLRRKYPNNFNKLTIPDKTWKRKLEEEEEGTHLLKDGSYVEWKRSAHRVHICIKDKWTWKEVDFDSNNVMNIVFCSGWFEYEVAEILSRWSHAKEVWLNVVYQYSAGNPKNEIDVVVNTGVKLLMVECKTQIFDNTDIDKFHTAVKNYGGMGCKSLFITDSVMKEAAKEKCSDSQILTFSLGEHNSLKQTTNELFALLDNELFNINAK